MLMGALVVGVAETHLEETQVDTGALGFFQGSHGLHLIGSLDHGANWIRIGSPAFSASHNVFSVNILRSISDSITQTACQ